jgi:hypothetical protein
MKKLIFYLFPLALCTLGPWTQDLLQQNIDQFVTQISMGTPPQVLNVLLDLETGNPT